MLSNHDHNLPNVDSNKPNNEGGASPNNHSNNPPNDPIDPAVIAAKNECCKKFEEVFQVGQEFPTKHAMKDAVDELSRQFNFATKISVTNFVCLRAKEKKHNVNDAVRKRTLVLGCKGVVFWPL